MADLAALQQQRKQLIAQIQAKGGKDKAPQLAKQLADLDVQIREAKKSSAGTGEGQAGTEQGSGLPATGDTGVSDNNLVDQEAGKTTGTTIGKGQTVNSVLLGEEAKVGDINIDQAAQAEFRNRQMQLADMLQQQAAGQGPSLAELQFKQMLDRNVAAARSVAASNAYANPALAGRLAAYGVGDANAAAARDAATARLQEVLAARDQLGAVLGQGRESDINLATNQAGLSRDVAFANQSAANQRMAQQAAFEQQAAQFNSGQLNQMLVDQARINAQIQAARIGGGATVGAAGIAAGASNYRTDADVLIASNQLEEQRRQHGINTGVAAV